ncbi:MAG: alpha/beta fold hydrolase [Gemmataceae bacterium]
MKASLNWLISSGAEFRDGDGQVGLAHLNHYTAEYREWGAGPPVVLIPGLAGGYALLGPLARALASRFRVISYNLRGEDDCFSLRRRFGVRDLAGDLAEFLDFLGLEAPPVVGISFGGMIALELATRFPYRLSKLAVQGVGARFEGGWLQQLALTVLSRYELPPDNPFINQFFNLFFGHGHPPPELFEFVTQQCWRTDQSVIACRFALAQHFDIAHRLDRLRVPMLAIAGDKDVLVSNRTLGDLGAGVEHSQLVRLRGAGHLAFLTDMERVVNELVPFLSQ